MRRDEFYALAPRAKDVLFFNKAFNITDGILDEYADIAPHFCDQGLELLVRYAQKLGFETSIKVTPAYSLVIVRLRKELEECYMETFYLDDARVNEALMCVILKALKVIC